MDDRALCNKEIGGGHKKDLTMRTALYVARVIHHDMVYANASAWNWWLAASTGDYKDGLIYANPDKDRLDGTYTDSKLMWTLGNYSRFIRPGAKRVAVSALDSVGNSIPEGDTDPLGLMLSAYMNIDGSLAIVIINYDTKDKQIDLKLKGTSVSAWVPYITSDKTGFNLKNQNNVKYRSEIIVPSRSVITLVSKD